MILPTVPPHLPHLPIYRKALEIVSLSRSISSYLHYDLCELEPDGSENAHIYFSGDIVQQSVSLAPEIVKAEQEVYPEQKHKHLAALSKLTHNLYANCIRLERSKSNGRDYLKILRKELHAFKRLQRAWMLSL
ncbi:MAG TPA: hypothetical protein VFF15_01725 [Flavobacteriaceae bacterium]|nr:hypothetical protein [Flavobacteriaceae bacterium]